MKNMGQSVLEMALLILVIVAALFAMQVYLKRGLQGHLRSASESIGEQYDPGATNSSFTMTHVSNVMMTSNSMAPTTVERYSCPPGYAPPSMFCVFWNETIAPTSTTIQTVYDITNRIGNEVVGAL